MGKDKSIDHINKTMDQSVADRAPILTPEQAIDRLKLTMQMAYIDAEAFTADPYALLGQVIQIRKQGGKCPTSITDAGFPAELAPYPVVCKVRESSKIKAPELRSSIIVNKALAANVSFLSYLSAELDAETHFSLIVFDQAKGLADTTDSSWRTSLEQWKKENADLINDPEICYLFAITGFVQKNIVRKKYVKFNGKASGGIYGININGELSTSTDDYSLDIKFGLTPVVIKRPSAPSEETSTRVVRGITERTNGRLKGRSNGVGKAAIEQLKPSRKELQLFSSITGQLPVAKKRKAAKAPLTKKTAVSKPGAKKAVVDGAAKGVKKGVASHGVSRHKTARSR
jgi:hypothetical protein